RASLAPAVRGAQQPGGRNGLQGGEQAAVDDVVGAGHVAGPVAGQEQDHVGDLGGPGEAAGDHLAGGPALDVFGGGAGGVADGLRDSAGAEPQVGGHGTGADGVDADAVRPEFFGQGLAEAGQPGLGHAVVQDGGVGEL